MTKKDRELIADLLIYLDVSLNYGKEIYIDNDIIKSTEIYLELTEKHKDFDDPRERQRIIRGLIAKLLAPEKTKGAKK